MTSLNRYFKFMKSVNESLYTGMYLSPNHATSKKESERVDQGNREFPLVLFNLRAEVKGTMIG